MIKNNASIILVLFYKNLILNSIVFTLNNNSLFILLLYFSTLIYVFYNIKRLLKN